MLCKPRLVKALQRGGGWIQKLPGAAAWGSACLWPVNWGGPSGFRKGLWEKCTILVPLSSLHRIAAQPRLGCHKPWLKFCAAGLAMLPEWGDG